MTAKSTRGQKAAKTLGRAHMAKIGARGGQNSPGNYTPGGKLARLAGRRSGMKRRMNKLLKEIANLEAERVLHPDKEEAAKMAAQAQEKSNEYYTLKAAYDGGHVVDADGTVLEYEQ